MRIAIVSYEYPPYPAGGIATYGEAAVRAFVQSGHEVHVITNRATYGDPDPILREPVSRSGRVTTHRLDLFDEQGRVPAGTTFLGLAPEDFADGAALWAGDPSSLAALRIADYVRSLHGDTPLDAIETPDMFAESFFMVRQRRAGHRDRYPPICVLGHTSARETHRAAGDALQMGGILQRHRVQREDACIVEADALQTPSRSLMRRYEAWFGPAALPLRRVICNFFREPSRTALLPEQLRGIGPYLLVVGRVEPRKGANVVLEAFARLRRELPELHLVFLGEPQHWPPGESFIHLVRDLLGEEGARRVLFPGVVSRGEVVAAARGAAAFVHPALWDNWPNVVLEAMTARATCVVSDHGGQAEMIEHDRSGLHFESGNVESLIQQLRRVLFPSEPGLAARLGVGADFRRYAVTDPGTIVRAKQDLFSAMNAPATARSQPPGGGLVVIDGGGAPDAWIGATAAAVAEALPDGDAWRRVLLATPGSAPAPPGFASVALPGPLPWLALAGAEPVVWLRAGARPRAGALRDLLTLWSDVPDQAGAFLWLARADPDLFPYRSDFGLQDALLAGAALPPVFAVAARHLARCRSFTGLPDPDTRTVAALATAAAAARLVFRHTGEVGGDDLAPELMVGHLLQTRVVGFLELLALLDDSVLWWGDQCALRQNLDGIRAAARSVRRSPLFQSLRRQRPR